MDGSCRKAERASAGAGAAPAPGGLYRPRNPRASPLWQCARRHAAELRAAGRLRRAVEGQVIERFIECGDPHHGFARIRCEACGHDYLLAFSCRTRYFCPSCHQKRVLLYGEWIKEEVLEAVPHRQYVFTVPRLLRPLFGAHRAWLGELCRVAARLLLEAYELALPGARPGLILFVQTFGDLANFNPHVHVLSTDGAFLPDGSFVALPPVPEAALEKGFQQAVLAFLAKAGAISEGLRDKLLAWTHSGFPVHNQVRVDASDAAGRGQLARYMLRAPVALEKMTYGAPSGSVIYRSKMHAGLKRNFRLMPGAQWLELLCRHIPDRYEHLVRYVRWYSNRVRGERAKRGMSEDATEALATPPEPGGAHRRPRGRAAHPRAPGALGTATHRARPARARLAPQTSSPSRTTPSPKSRSAARGRSACLRSLVRRLTRNFAAQSVANGPRDPEKRRAPSIPGSPRARNLPANGVATAALAQSRAPSRIDSPILLMKPAIDADLLVLDDLFMARHIAQEAADELQALVHKRYKLRRSTLITSNRVIADWDKYLGDSALATTILDRLMHRRTLIEFKGRSYRLKEATARLAKAEDSQ